VLQLTEMAVTMPLTTVMDAIVDPVPLAPAVAPT
jgi:hypothetical protein